MKRILSSLALGLVLASCGTDTYDDERTPPTIVHQPKTSDLMIIATASFPVSISNVERLFATTQPVTVILGPNTSFSLSTTGWTVPTMTNAVLSFGSLAASTLESNNLKICGTEHKTKCNRAYLRVYTTGAGAGFWNADADTLPTPDPYGVPMSVMTTTTVLLGSANAITVQSATIAARANTLKLNDFVSTTMPFGGDFTLAGAGTYATTINVELALGIE